MWAEDVRRESELGALAVVVRCGGMTPALWTTACRRGTREAKSRANSAVAAEIADVGDVRLDRGARQLGPAVRLAPCRGALRPAR